MFRMPKTYWALLALALLLTVAGNARADELKGIINSITPDAFQLVLEDNDGQFKTIEMDEDFDCYINDRPVQFGDLHPATRSPCGRGKTPDSGSPWRCAA